LSIHTTYYFTIPSIHLADNQEPGTIFNVNEHHNLPDANRLSVLSAVILLGYGLMHVLELPTRSLELLAFGVYLPLRVDIHTLLSILIAGLAAVGSDWLLRSHPSLEEGSTIDHWILPALTAWVIGVPLYSLPGGLMWWGAFALATAILILVFVAEYITVDPSDVLYPLATAALTGISLALFLILTISMMASNAGLYILLPALAPAAGLVSLRTLSLRLGERRVWGWAVAIALLTAQFATGLHYLPLSPIRFGLLLLGIPFALISFAGSLEEGKPVQNWLIEPLLLLTFLWGLALWLK
jgi:hypothetical protein